MLPLAQTLPWWFPWTLTNCNRSLILRDGCHFATGWKAGGNCKCLPVGSLAVSLRLRISVRGNIKERSGFWPEKARKCVSMEKMREVCGGGREKGVGWWVCGEEEVYIYNTNCPFCGWEAGRVWLFGRTFSHTHTHPSITVEICLDANKMYNVSNVKHFVVCVSILVPESAPVLRFSTQSLGPEARTFKRNSVARLECFFSG